MQVESFSFADGRFECRAHAHLSDRPVATVLMLPAIGVPAAKYRTFVDACLTEGWNVVIGDLPGNGESRPRPSRRADYGYEHLVTQFVPSLSEIAEGRFGGIPKVLAGHSLGGQVVTLYSHWHGAERMPAVSLAGGNVRYSHWDGLAKLKTPSAAIAFSVITALLGYMPGSALGFGRYEAKRMMRQWARVAFSGRFDHIPFARCAAPRTGWKALYVGFEGDDYAPPRSVAALSASFSGESRLVHLEVEGRANANPHGSWVKQPRVVIDTMRTWLRDASPRIASRCP